MRGRCEHLPAGVMDIQMGIRTSGGRKGSQHSEGSLVATGGCREVRSGLLADVRYLTYAESPADPDYQLVESGKHHCTDCVLVLKSIQSCKAHTDCLVR